VLSLSLSRSAIRLPLCVSGAGHGREIVVTLGDVVVESGKPSDTLWVTDKPSGQVLPSNRAKDRKPSAWAVDEATEPVV